MKKVEVKDSNVEICTMDQFNKVIAQTGALITRPESNEVEIVKPSNDTDFNLKELQDIVEGSIGAIFTNEYTFVFSDNGIAEGKDINFLAADLRMEVANRFDLLFGNILICKNEMFK